MTTFRGDLAPPHLWFTRLRYLSQTVVKPSPLLLEQRPPGWQGGDIAVFSTGALLDTRDRELWTRRGVATEASLFANPSLGSLSQFGTHGADVTARGYASLWAGGSLAVRGLAEIRRGDVPSFKWIRTEGIYGGEGLGGANSIRGVARDRISGPDKLNSTVELRQLALPLNLLARNFDLGFAGGFDTGWAHQPGYAPVSAAGAFVGFRMLVDRASHIRVDVGYAGLAPPAIYFLADDTF
ncbi:MAG TPA: hypothetical protein VFG53_04385 [Anaeromyxobacter sp.]|nr:hypothetical protein [Anaeromyxobacter sp.]